MPNGGNPSFNLQEQETWFAPLAETISDFARARDLTLDKYYHESAGWDLRFKHPSGGEGSVTVYNGGAVARIGAVWYLDDYDQSTRFIHSRPPRALAKTPEDVHRELIAELAAILAVPVGQWTQIAKGYQAIWGRYTKAQFESMHGRYSYPRT